MRRRSLSGMSIVATVCLALHLAMDRDLLAGGASAASPGHRYNGPYTGAFLDQVAFPMGGMGAGMICLEGSGAISHVSLRHRMDLYNAPCSFAALCVKSPQGNIARVLEGPVPGWKIFGPPNTGNGAGSTSYGLPRFDEARFLARFPFGTIELADDKVPLSVEITGWSPFVPGDADASSLPVASLEYRFENKTDRSIEAVFSYNTRHFMRVGNSGYSIRPIDNGFILHQEGTTDHPEYRGDCALFVDQPAVVDHCWFKGGWFDALTLVWRSIQSGTPVDNPPAGGEASGASLFVPVALEPGETRTVRLTICWYVPESTLRSGQDAPASGPAFGYGPSHGTASDQQAVSGFIGRGLVNTYDPSGDGLTGTLTSRPFVIERPHLQFLIGGGSHAGKTCLELLVGGQPVRSASGHDREALALESWDLADLVGETAVLRVVDQERGPWGHVNVDQIVAVDRPFATAAELAAATANARPGRSGAGWTLLADFEGETFSGWTASGPPAPRPPVCEGEDCCPTTTYKPWYAARFRSIEEVASFWREHGADLRRESARFRDAFYASTLPPEVLEAVAANLTILKSPTVLRQCDGRLWCFEGCSDGSGCCAGSCTHVWNYAQAIPHLFPALERTLRETEFLESQDETGHQTFRSCLPIRPVAHTFHAAADGQLGGIMKVYREWRICGDTDWLRSIWPRVKQSLDYCARTWDPRERGVLEEPHHNTYDIEYWGPEGHCSSFYLGALTAAAEMGTALGEDVTHYRELARRGRAVLENELYNGEYFYQKIQTDGLDATFRPLKAADNGPGYAEVVGLLNAQGPKYQYGTGCLSDGVLGFWMARMCGLDQEIIDPEMVRTDLASIYRYNFKRDLSGHANPQRPSYALGKEAGLLLCTWPHGSELALPFVYSNEVWTGIEYQVASHCMLAGLVDEGLEIVRACRDRYDGRVRNPFDEYECGHWYARALSSYGLLQGLTGVRYDAIDRTLRIDSRLGDDFRSFLSTATGWGNVGLRAGRPFLEVKKGRIDVARVLVSGEESSL